jgi:hypothetical protein
MVRGFDAMALVAIDAILNTMTFIVDIDPRIARLCLHAGRQQALV